MSKHTVPPVSARDVFEGYRRYVSGLDDFCRSLREKYWGAMSCRPGCVDCCSEALRVFPLEAAWMRGAFESLGAPRRSQIREHLETYGASGREEPCPLLFGGRCLLYPARPLLCRTEGFILAHRSRGEGHWRVSVCPRNFEGVDLVSEIPRAHLINLESLNQSLAVLNHAYVGASRWAGPERIPLREILSAPLVLS